MESFGNGAISDQTRRKSHLECEPILWLTHVKYIPTVCRACCRNEQLVNGSSQAEVVSISTHRCSRDIFPFLAWTDQKKHSNQDVVPSLAQCVTRFAPTKQGQASPLSIWCVVNTVDMSYRGNWFHAFCLVRGQCIASSKMDLRSLSCQWCFEMGDRMILYQVKIILNKILFESFQRKRTVS